MAYTEDAAPWVPEAMLEEAMLDDAAVDDTARVLLWTALVDATETVATPFSTVM
jgi:hypothetical protein